MCNIISMPDGSKIIIETELPVSKIKITVLPVSGAAVTKTVTIKKEV